MTLHSPPLERRLRQTAREAVQDSATLRREAKRLRRARPRGNSSDAGVMRLVATALLIVVMWVGTVHQVSFQYSLAIIGLWGVMSVAFQASGLADRLYQDAAISPLLLLPVPDHVIFHWQTQAFLRRNLCVWIDCAAAFTYLAVISNLQPAAWPALLIMATTQWLIILGLTAAVVAYPTRAIRAAQLVVPVLLIVFFLLVVDRKYVGPRIASWIDATAPWLTLVLPTGWAAALFDRGLLKHEWVAFVLTGPIALILALGFRGWKQLRNNYTLNVTDTPQQPDETESTVEISPPPRTTTIGPTELLDGIQAREFLQPMRLESPGPTERFVFDRLTARDKLLVESMAAEPIRWSARWRNAALLMAAGMAVSWLLQRLGMAWFGWVDGITLLIGAGLTLSTGLRVRVELPGALPVTVREIAWLKMKLAIVRGVAALPLFLAYGALLAWRLNEPVAFGASVGAKVVALLVAVRPFLAVASISSGTNDTRLAGLKSVWMIAVLVVCVLGIIGLALIAIIADFAPGALLAGWCFVPAVAVVSWLCLAYYQRQFNRCRFDLTQLLDARQDWREADTGS